MSEKGFTKQMTDKIKAEIQKAVVSQDMLTDMALTALLAGGHVLVEGVPGLAKTLWAKSMAKALNLHFRRTQFTADLMPSDLLGTKILNMKTSEFEFKRGPLFTNVFLADEINRTPPKTQSALLEAMEEHAITVDGQVNGMMEPFWVMATQNPIEYDGTYPLPEALLDRFMMKLYLDYPGVAAEKQVLQRVHGGFDSVHLENAGIQPVCTPQDLQQCKAEVRQVTVDDSVLNYIISIVETTRHVSTVAMGASPRGSIALLQTSKAYAAMAGRDFVMPDDIKLLALPVLRHRILLKPEAEIDGIKTDRVIQSILTSVPVPR